MGKKKLSLHQNYKTSFYNFLEYFHHFTLKYAKLCIIWSLFCCGIVIKNTYAGLFFFFPPGSLPSCPNDSYFKCPRFTNLVGYFQSITDFRVCLSLFRSFCFIPAAGLYLCMMPRCAALSRSAGSGTTALPAPRASAAREADSSPGAPEKPARHPRSADPQAL